jgi:APA family basic amino acid/polyamine antiporter
MSRDGLLPLWFAGVDRRGTPQRVTWIAGLGAALLAGVFPIREVADLTNIGILSAFIVVCVAVILFRYTRPDAPRTFRLPWMLVVPAFGVLASLFLVLQLHWQTWVRLVVWLIIGLIIYFAYGRKHSLLKSRQPVPPEGTGPSIRAVGHPPTSGHRAHSCRQRMAVPGVDTGQGAEPAGSFGAGSSRSRL